MKIVSCESYINKVLNHHGWQESHTQHNLIQMKEDGKYQMQMETTTLPTPAEAKALQNKHFNYRQAIGEAIYAMVTHATQISPTQL